MNRVLLLKRWQSYNPDTGTFDRPRTNREYAEALGIHESYLSKCYLGISPVGLKALSGLAQLFPDAAIEIATAMTARLTTAEVA